MKAELKRLPKSEIEINFELDEQEFRKYIDKALEHLKGHVKMDGFRPGQVPKEIVEKKVGNEDLLMEAGDLAVKENYTKFINENNLEPIGQPEVQITKIAKGSPFLFTVKVSVLSEIELPDYKEIASKVKGNKISVDEKEIEEAVNYLQKSRAKFTEKNPSTGSGRGDFVEIEYQSENINNGKAIKDRFILSQGGFLKDFEDNLVGMKAGQEKEFISKFPENTSNKELAGKESKFKVKVISVQKMELPEVNDQFSKSLGSFDGLVALKEGLKEGIIMEKQEAEKQRKRGEILNMISQKIHFAIPEKIVEKEKTRLFEELKNQVSQNFKISFEEYLSSIKKTEEEIKKSFEVEAEKRIKNFLVLKQIGKAENIEVSNEELKEEMNKVIKNKPFDTAQSEFDIEQLKEYTKGAMLNEKIFQLLENFSKKN